MTLAVLAPGERTQPIRQNSTQVSFCIRGRGDGGRRRQARIDFAQYDAWNVPSYRTYWYVNDGDDCRCAWSTRTRRSSRSSNVHVVERGPAPRTARRPEEPARAPTAGRTRGAGSPFGALPLGDDGAMLMPYELLVAPPAVESRPLHWPWAG